MRVVLAADHGGYELKERIKKHLTGRCSELIDIGALEYLALDGFTDYSNAAVNKILETSGSFGIFVCGSGVLASMAANRYKGIRAALCHRIEYAIQSREHNDANVLCLGGRYLDFEDAKKIVDTFLATKFLDGKYRPRIEALDE